MRRLDAILPPSERARAASDRWVLIRDALVFQVKLALDALRDLVLSPVSLAAALVGLVVPERRPLFYDLLALGRRSERWIDLFGAARVGWDEERELPAGIDAWVARLEQTLAEQSDRGGVSAGARQQIDRLLDALEGLGRRR
jgi:hypothetical protein